MRIGRGNRNTWRRSAQLPLSQTRHELGLNLGRRAEKQETDRLRIPVMMLHLHPIVDLASEHVTIISDIKIVHNISRHRYIDMLFHYEGF
jgi:hypothetical protein